MDIQLIFENIFKRFLTENETKERPSQTPLMKHDISQILWKK